MRTNLYFQLVVYFVVILSLVFIAEVESKSDLTGQERSLVQQMRPLVEKFLKEDYMKTDEYLVRFLRVADYNLNAAKDHLIKMLVWRKDNKIDKILLEDFSEYERQFPFLFDGSVDLEGRPLLFINIGAFDFRKVALSGNKNGFLRYYERLLETSFLVLNELNDANNQTEELITKSYTVIDLNRFNLRQHACVSCLQIINSLFKTYEDYYPDLFHRFYIINAPRTFPPVFELIRPFLSAPTQKAIKIFDHDSIKWKQVLQSEISPSQLPVQYGGARITSPKTVGELKKTNPLFKAVFDKATDRFQ